MARQSVFLALVVSLAVFQTLHAAPMLDTVIGNFLREFFFSGGTMDQDDEPFRLDIDPPADNADEAKEKKVLVLSKDDEDSEGLPRVRSMAPSRRTKRQAASLMNNPQVQKLLTDVGTQLKDPKIQSRTIGEFLDGFDESFMSTMGVSAMSGLRAFFSQMMSNFFN